MRNILEAVGVGMLPEEAWGRTPYWTDWIESEETQALLRYERHSFDDIVKDIAALLGWRRALMPLARPLVRRRILSLSRHWGERRGERLART